MEREKMKKNYWGRKGVAFFIIFPLIFPASTGRWWLTIDKVAKINF
jgi:hypothetical protein